MPQPEGPTIPRTRCGGSLEVEAVDRASARRRRGAGRELDPTPGGRRSARRFRSGHHLGILAHSALLTKVVRKVDKHPPRGAQRGPGNHPLRIRHRRARRHDRHGRRLADDAAADPDLRDPADDGDRHRHLLLGDHQDGRRLAPLADEDGEHGAGHAGWRSAASRPRWPASPWSPCCRTRSAKTGSTRLVYAVLGGTLLMVGIITLARALILRNLIDERDRFEVERRHKVAAVVIGATTGFVIGDHLGRLRHRDRDPADRRLPALRRRRSSAPTSSTPRSCSGRPAIAHWIGGNVDFGLAGNILVGSMPGVVIGAALSDRAPQGFIRTALGLVLSAPASSRSRRATRRLADRRRRRRARPRPGHLRAALAQPPPREPAPGRGSGGQSACARREPDRAAPRSLPAD